MSIVMGVEIGRTEVRSKTALSLLSTEVQEKILNTATANKGSRSGFVILVDIVGWTKKKKNLSPDLKNLYNKTTLEYLFRSFDDQRFSLAQQAGDAIYVTCTSEPSQEWFNEVISRCRALAEKRPTLAELGFEGTEVSNERLAARSAVYYGEYDLVIAQSKFHRKEAFTSTAPETLARIIGNDPDPHTVRVVAGTALDRFKPVGASVQEVPGKESEPPWRYWEV